MVEACRSLSHVCRLLYSASGRGSAVELDEASSAAATPWCGAAVVGQLECCPQAQGEAQSTSEIRQGRRRRLMNSTAWSVPLRNETPSNLRSETPFVFFSDGDAVASLSSVGNRASDRADN